MRARILLVWAACLLMILQAILRFALATAPERALTLALLGLAGVFALRGRK